MDITTILLVIGFVLGVAGFFGVCLAKIAAPRDIREDDGSYE